MSFSGAGKGRGAHRQPYQPDKSLSRPMYCAYCGELKTWPQDFRVSHYAECKVCYPLPPAKVQGARWFLPWLYTIGRFLRGLVFG